MNAMFSTYMAFECRHNIQNQPVSTAIPSPNSFRDITMIGTHQHFGKILKDIFSFFFNTVWHLDGHNIQTNIIISPLSIGFHFYTQVSSFSQVGLSLSFIQVPKHLGLPQHLPTPPTNNTTILLPTLTCKKSASLEYLTDNIIFNIDFQLTYPAHYQPKNS